MHSGKRSCAGNRSAQPTFCPPHTKTFGHLATARTRSTSTSAMLTGHLHSWLRPPDQTQRQPSARPLAHWRPGLCPTARLGRCRTSAVHSAPPELKKPEAAPTQAQANQGSREPAADGDAGGFWSPFSWNVLASSQQFATQLLSHFSRWPGARWPGSQAEQVRERGIHACAL